MEKVNALSCERENDLIGFLYGELNESEALDFQRHVSACSACSTELADIGSVRESVVAWRNESLGSIALPAETMASSATRASQASRSALAALREFFNLSPLWLKGAVACAAVLFCVFAGLAVARLQAGPSTAVVVAPVAPANSQKEINALVERRVQEELNRIKKSKEELAAPLIARGLPEKNPVKRIANRSNEVAIGASSQKARRPLTKAEREQLAADLRLVTAKSDSVLDLLDDTINR